MAYINKARRLQGFVAMPDGHRHIPRLHGVLNQIADDYSIDLIFAHERLSTHLLLRKNLRRLVARSDFVLCFADGQDPDIAFEAGLACGGAGAPADPGRRAPVERKDQVASNHAGQRVPDKTDRTSVELFNGRRE
jgi:hypothetical protein